ncbi:MAG: PEP-CTERM sorting domain-containing protein [Akkermansiaceae bacterium]
MNTIIGLLALSGTAFAQTVSNGDFELFSDASEGVKYTSELADGVNFTATVTDWKLVNDMSLYQRTYMVKEIDPKTGKETGKEIETKDTSLRIGASEKEFANLAHQGLEFKEAGTYTISFDSFMANEAKTEQTASIALYPGSGSESPYFSSIFTEKSDGFTTDQSFTFTLDKKHIEAAEGKFELVFSNTGFTEEEIKEGAKAYDMFVDNVSIAAVPEPSSTALLGLGALGLLVRRKR